MAKKVYLRPHDDESNEDFAQRLLASVLGGGAEDEPEPMDTWEAADDADGPDRSNAEIADELLDRVIAGRAKVNDSAEPSDPDPTSAA